MQDELDTVSRPGTDYHRITEAIRAFSLRPYFTRLWIIQEVCLAKERFLACGASVFPLSALEALEYDCDEAGLRVHAELPEGVRRLPVSWHFNFLLRGFLVNTPIWELAAACCDFHCYDLRDRVYGVLSMADNKSQRIWPDYTKSSFNVLLDFLDHASSARAVGDLYNMDDVLRIIGSFRLGPDAPRVSELLQQRRECWSKTAARRSVKIASSTRNPHRLHIEVQSHCQISRSLTGTLVAPLSEAEARMELQKLEPGKYSPWCYGVDDAFQSAIKESPRTAALIYSREKVAALVDVKAEGGDWLLFFGPNGPRDAGLQTPIAGLLVRSTAQLDQYRIIGQAIYNPRFSPCGPCRNREQCICVLKDEADVKDDRKLRVMDSSPAFENPKWTVHLTPEDLLAFVAADLRFQLPLKEENGRAPVMELYVAPEESLKRLKTSATTSDTQSYATCRHL